MAGKQLKRLRATLLHQKTLPLSPMIRRQRSQTSQTSQINQTSQIKKTKRAPRLRKLPKKLPRPKSPVVIEARVPGGKLMYQSQFDQRLKPRRHSAVGVTNGQLCQSGCPARHHLRIFSSYAAGLVLLLGLCGAAMAQAGRRPSASTE